ncbi:MAG: ComEC/Rec2 family competence protein [Sediminibacterium sp.]
MEKSVGHWKAQHPLLFISLSLCLGYVLADYFEQFLITIDNKLAMGILVLSILCIYLIHYSPLKFWIQGILILWILIIWGGILFITMKSKNILWIPYPRHFIINVRLWFIQKIDMHLTDQEASGFAKALLIGVKTDIDKNIIKAYTQLGIIHIIAISGMHLDIIFKNLIYVTQHLPRKIIWQWIELIIVIVAVWSYTFIAFASPSIVRASIFFSLFFLGSFFQQPKYTLNCIAAGILIILFFDTHSIYNIGLQLSYAAVIGIHLFYPLFYKMLPMDNPILNWMWSNLCITVSAQLTTLPILLFHFQQTSTLIIISNFIMVPLSTILLYALIILVILPNQVIIIIHLGQWLQWSIKLLNRGVLYFHQNPIGAPILIQMSGYIVTLYFIGLLLVYLWLYYRQAKFLFYTLIIFSLGFFIKLFP